MSAGGGDTTGAAIIALMVLLGARALDWILPKGWHLKMIRRFGEPDEKEDDEP